MWCTICLKLQFTHRTKYLTFTNILIGKGGIFTYLFGDIQGKHEGCGFPDEASNPPSVTDLIELSWFVGQLEQHGKSNNAL